MKFFLTLFFLFPSTSVFAKCISGDCNNGYGTYLDDYGTKYVGEWKNNSANGQGTLIFGTGEWEGDKYIGEFKNDLYEGQGTYTFADGTIETGIWKNSELVTPN